MWQRWVKNVNFHASTAGHKPHIEIIIYYDYIGCLFYRYFFHHERGSTKLQVVTIAKDIRETYIFIKKIYVYLMFYIFHHDCTLSLLKTNIKNLPLGRSGCKPKLRQEQSFSRWVIHSSCKGSLISCTRELCSVSLFLHLFLTFKRHSALLLQTTINSGIRFVRRTATSCLKVTIGFIPKIFVRGEN